MLLAARGWPSADASVVRTPLPAPSPDDRRGPCADVGRVRACWSPECAGGVCASERTTPAGPAPRAGWRCDGMGGKRTCEDRRRNAGPFECDATRCVQRRPRMPDDGQWECVDMDGVAYCHEVSESAGVVPGAPDMGWTCGARRGHAERVCVDMAPDLPEGEDRWQCHFDHAADDQRVCVRAVQPNVGGPCSATGACPASASCVGDVCLPSRRPEPACWFDADCEPGMRCRWASCVGAQP
jgi:hypothetical protein